MQKPCITNYECMKYKLKRMFYSVHELWFFSDKADVYCWKVLGVLWTFTIFIQYFNYRFYLFFIASWKWISDVSSIPTNKEIITVYINGSLM